MEGGDRKKEMKCVCKGVTLNIRKSLRAAIRFGLYPYSNRKLLKGFKHMMT